VAKNQHPVALTGPKTIDGFRPPAHPRGGHKAINLHQAPKVFKVNPKPLPKAELHHVKSHKTERAHTLMRTAVKKPAHPFRRHANVQARTDILAKVPEHSLSPKPGWQSVDARRASLAKQVAKNKLVSRFGGSPVLQAPQPNRSDGAIMQPARFTSLKPAVHHAAQGVHHDKHSMDIFEHALQRATSHTQKPLTKRELAATKHVKKSHKIASFSAAIATVIILAGFFFYQNSANLTMKVAAAKAGFSAHLPGYQPSGFAVSKFSYSTGAVAVAFKSTSGDGRSYQLTQKSSNWDSSTLLHEYVASASSSHETFLSAGRTVYTYGDNNATWVDNGVWYTITSNGGLSSHQLLDLASSM